MRTRDGSCTEDPLFLTVWLTNKFFLCPSVTRVFNLSVPVLGAAAKVDLMGSVRVDVTAVLAAREHALAASKGDADVGASL